MQQDHLLIETFLSERSEAAFRQLYRDKTPGLFQMALRLTSNRANAEELVQKTWVLAIEKIKNFQRKSSFQTWLIGILINLFREQTRKQTRQSKSVNETFMSPEPSSINATMDSIDLEKAVQTLSPGYKEILILHDVEGYTHKEIGEMLKISSGTSKSQLFQARKILRKQLYDNYKTQ